MTTLLLDVGNSRLKWGLPSDNTIAETGDFPLQDLQRHGLAKLTSRIARPVSSAIACNVAGLEVGDFLADLIAGLFGCSLNFVRSTASACGVSNAYQSPESLGVDRWVAMIGAQAATQAACLVVDAGTAITLDALDAHGKHLGGQILPGFRLMADSLGRKTSDLPGIDPGQGLAALSGSSLATSTQGAIAQGLLGAVLGATDRAIRAARKDCPELAVLLTGGDAAIIHRHLGAAAEQRPHLVLEGLLCLARADALD